MQSGSNNFQQMHLTNGWESNNLGHSETGNNGDEGTLHTRQNSITEFSTLDVVLQTWDM